MSIHSETKPQPSELTLDPEDWEPLRTLGHRMVDDMLEFLQGVRERPVYNAMPQDVRAAFEAPMPREPTDASLVYEQFKQTVLPYPHGNIHPRFWGWVVGTGTPLGMFADMLAAGINSNSGFGDHCVMHVERQVLNWLREGLGFGGSGGVLTSGCTAANLAGLTLARNTKAGWDIRAQGLAATKQPLTVYGSCETHSSNFRAMEVLGLGRDALRAVPVDEQHQIRVDLLRDLISADRAAGCQPIAVIGNAGTVNVGAFDDLNALGDVCQEQDLWLHVDGAFGALVGLSPALRPLVSGLERVDSLAFDLHKWLHVPYDAAALLVRDGDVQTETFAMEGAYLSHFDSGLATGPENYMQRGLQMSRGFRALKAWMTIKEHGSTRLGELIHQNVRQASYLAGLVDAAPELERCGPVPLNIVCFRYVGKPGARRSDPDQLNRKLLAELHESGIAAPSHTVLEGHFLMRVAITNHRSRLEDFDLLVREVLKRGQQL